LHTLHTGTVKSKKAGADWAKQRVAPRWVSLIEQAWQEREGVRFGGKISWRAETKALHRTLEFMEYAVTLVQANSDNLPFHPSAP
jgi:hypothetical protein